MKNIIGICIYLLIPALAIADLETNVPEAQRDGYQSIYRWNIPVSANLGNNNVNYDVDNSPAWNGSYDRIAYYLKLKKPNEDPQFIFVTGQAWNQNIERISIPRHNWLYPVEFSDMTVLSNVPGIVTGENLAGYLEIWNSNYGPPNALGVSGASGSKYDFGDEPVSGGGGYGSFQVHNPAAQQTLIAVNHFNNGVIDVGIGNHDGDHPDWTFSGSANQYEVRQLEVLVRPGDAPDIPLPRTINITSPKYCHIHQRWPADSAQIRITGRASEVADTVEARFVDLVSDEATDWTVIDVDIAGGGFVGEMTVSSGWYRLEVRGLEDGIAIERGEISGIGVGEVFMIAGQSNSANSGQPRLSPSDERVCTGSLGGGWQFGEDPQPGANGSGGSPWPAFGDLIAQKFDVPVGIVSVGVGGTQVLQWQPGHASNLFQNLLNGAQFVGPNGARMLLWHQGESDAASNTSTDVYARRLTDVITSMRQRIGWDIPWGIAEAAFLPNLADCRREDPVCVNVNDVLDCVDGPIRCPASDAVLAGQRRVAATVAHTILGPTTEDMTGDEWRYDEVHFNEAGLREHAARWAAIVELPQCRNLKGIEDEWFCQNGEPIVGCPVTGPVEETCNTIDDDCDGQIDEGLTVATTCGVGACSATGEARCVDGQIIEMCMEGMPVMEACDGADNDCDGTIDEDVLDNPIMCGVGACEAAGVSRCLAGSPVDICLPNEPMPESCDGSDNDCDGMVDEDILAMDAECGVGACTATGTATCVDGALVSDCTPSAPSDETCDGLDNDCDGRIDELPPTIIECGEGMCRTSGIRNCSEGQLVDSCTPGEPSDEVCDGLDNDCDGQLDEEQTETVTTCGTGACASEGLSVCMDGQPVNTCAPKTPDSETCDEIDNDCDGQVDENEVCQKPADGSTDTSAPAAGGESASGGRVASAMGGTSSNPQSSGSDSGGCSAVGTHHDVPIWLALTLLVGWWRRRNLS